MNDTELQNKLNEILSLPCENEVVEFKEAKNGFDLNKLGKYFSALSNEANLNKVESAWLLFGVKNDKTIVGTSFRKSNQDLHSLKGEIANHTNNISFIDIFEISKDGKRIIMFQIPPAPQNVPVSYKGHFYARNGEELTHLSLENIERIRNQNLNYDWSAQISDNVTFDDLNPEALELAKEGFLQKNPHLKSESESWNTEQFLKKAKMLNNGKVTNSAVLLLGTRDLIPNHSGSTEISWKEITLGATPELFEIPFVLAIPKAINKIAINKIELNRKFFGHPETNIFKSNYTLEILRECVANAVAHQDYSKNARIIILESIHKQVVIRNHGVSLYNKEEFNKIRESKETPDRYRNRFLVECMREIGLVESQGTGHRKIFEYNTKEVYLPLPEVDWNDKERFVLTIYGATLDPRFAEILQQCRDDLEPEQILLLDQVQKNLRINPKEFTKLKKKGLVEGAPTKPRLTYEIALASQKVEEEDTKTQLFNFRNIFEASFLPHIKTRKNGMTKQEIIDFAHKHIKYTAEIDSSKLTQDILNSLQKLKLNKKIESQGTNKRLTKWYYLS
jgi:ATP-dependent DNA helicase RecG